ncbi:MAG: hypothetical protein ACFFDI_30240 [Promethearchaeota archaeon]
MSKTLIVLFVVSLLLCPFVSAITVEQPAFEPMDTLSGLSNSEAGSMMQLLQQETSSSFSFTWGTPSSIELGNGILLAQDGSIYTIGAVADGGYYDLLLIKWDDKGNRLWNRTWGYSSHDWGNSIAEASDGTIYTVGYTNPVDTISRKQDLLLVKWDTDGVQLWNRTWGDLDYDYGNDLVIGKDGSIYTVGTLFSGDIHRLILLKWDSEGNLVWSRTHGQSSDLWGRYLATDASNNIYTLENLGHSFVLVKWNPNGNEVWSHSETDVEATGMVVGKYGDVFVVGMWAGLYIGRWTPNGIKVWERDWISVDMDSCWGKDLVIGTDENIYAVGMAQSSGIEEQTATVVKWDSEGTYLGHWIWETTFYHRIEAATIDNQNHIYLVGYVENRSENEMPSDNDLLVVIYFNSEMTSVSYITYARGFHMGSELLVTILTLCSVCLLILLTKRRKNSVN